MILFFGSYLNSPTEFIIVLGINEEIPMVSDIFFGIDSSNCFVVHELAVVAISWSNLLLQ